MLRAYDPLLDRWFEGDTIEYVLHIMNATELIALRRQVQARERLEADLARYTPTAMKLAEAKRLRKRAKRITSHQDQPPA